MTVRYDGEAGAGTWSLVRVRRSQCDEPVTAYLLLDRSKAPMVYRRLQPRPVSFPCAYHSIYPESVFLLCICYDEITFQ